ncbi:MAG: maleylpyruvate isomerase N-terminal domain-containing protein [Pseudonocardiaceae bacterium]
MPRMTIFGPMLDTRPLFPEERRELLRSLSPAAWSRATVCPGWDVHDVVGHVLNDYLRRLSGSRDHFTGAIFVNDETLPSYLARTNDEFVRAARQCSPQVMIELLEHLGHNWIRCGQRPIWRRLPIWMSRGQDRTPAQPGWTSPGTTRSSGYISSRSATPLIVPAPTGRSCNTP